jgi:hypothetical protein
MGFENIPTLSGTKSGFLTDPTSPKILASFLVVARSVAEQVFVRDRHNDADAVYLAAQIGIKKAVRRKTELPRNIPIQEERIQRQRTK